MDTEDLTQPTDQPVETTAADEFDTAFAAATADEPVTNKPDAVDSEPADTQATSKPSSEEQAPADVADAPAAPTLDGAEQEPEAVAPPPKADVPPAEPTPPLDPKYLAKAIVEAQAEAAKTSAPAQEPAAPKEYTADDFFSDDDKVALKKLEQDWPDEYKVFGRLAMAHAQAHALNYANQVLAQVDKALAPIVQVLSRSEVNNHRSAVYAAHADFDQVLPEVEKWVNGQSELVRPALQQALKAGSARDVIQLVAMYKEANGQSGAAPAR